MKVQRTQKQHKELCVVIFLIFAKIGNISKDSRSNENKHALSIVRVLG